MTVIWRECGDDGVERWGSDIISASSKSNTNRKTISEAGEDIQADSNMRKGGMYFSFIKTL